MKNIFRKIYEFFTVTPKTNYSRTNMVIYSEYYYQPICPKCNEILNEKKARYETRCCYKCGFSNGFLFTLHNRIVRDKYINGVFICNEIANEKQ